MQQTFGKYPYDQQTINRIRQIISQNPQAQRIIFQYPKQYLKQSFSLSSYLQKQYPASQNHRKQFYTLFDSMKKECCTDIIGAEHINYDILIHFGTACFSQPIKKNHYYLFPTISKQLQKHLLVEFQSQQFLSSLVNNHIKYVLVEQNLYNYFKGALQHKFQQKNVFLLRLPYDVLEGQYQYLIFGYYAKKVNSNLNSNNVLVVLSEHPQSDNQLLSNIHLTVGSFSSNKQLFSSTPQIFVSSLEVPQIQKSNINYSKALMSRYAQISEIQKYDTFGLLVSNAGTHFCKRMIQKCKKLLKKNNKKYFVFMMNNLNQVKLGNFPQIQVYVVISCYNNSCFSMKDFCRLVVTPMDLEVAFNNVSIGQYNFDLNSQQNIKKDNNEQEITKQQQQISQNKPIQQVNQNNLALSVQQKQQLILAQTFQTLDYYRHKQYKGLDFSQKKPVQKFKKGKIGLAQSYQPLEK